MSRLWNAESGPFVDQGRVPGFFSDLSGIISLAAVFYFGSFENLWYEKNSAGIIKNYGFCLFSNNFNFIFA
ncbi:hypothetical protein CE91St19_28580 [Odoribacter laneus]|jgi:hypothetical protein|nr:hypothetical protein CE91St19_28580 [Odoribacter laneus]GKI24267.1 hypothetical protein CE91St20_04040 [Odoribacter laneus]